MPWRSVKRIIEELKEGGDDSNLDPVLAQRLMVAIVERVYNLVRVMIALVVVTFILMLGLQVQVLNVGHTTDSQKKAIESQRDTIEVLRQTVSDQGDTIQAIREGVVASRNSQLSIQDSTNQILKQLQDAVTRNTENAKALAPIIASILRTEYAVCGGQCPDIPAQP